MSKLVDLTERRRWNSPVTEPEKAREPKFTPKLHTDDEFLDAMSTSDLLERLRNLSTECRQLKMTLMHRATDGNRHQMKSAIEDAERGFMS